MTTNEETIRGQRWLIGVLILVLGVLLGAGTINFISGSDITDNSQKIAVNENDIETISAVLEEVRKDVKTLLTRVPARVED